MASDLKSGMSEYPGHNEQKSYRRFSGDNEPIQSPTHGGVSPPFGGDFQAVLYAQPPRKIADPAPLGFISYATTNFVASMIDVGFGGVHQANIVVAMAMSLGALGMFVAGMWEMAIGNTFAATAFAAYGGFWFSYALIFTPALEIVTQLEQTSDIPFDYSVGFFLLVWAIFTTLCLLCTLKSNMVFFMLFLTLDVTFIFLSAGYLSSDGSGPGTGWIKAGGIFGLASSALGFYIGFAGMADQSNTFFTVPVAHFPWSEEGRKARKARNLSRSEDV